jgi:hypothetical protein
LRAQGDQVGEQLRVIDGRGHHWRSFRHSFQFRRQFDLLCDWAILAPRNEPFTMDQSVDRADQFHVSGR